MESLAVSSAVRVTLRDLAWEWYEVDSETSTEPEAEWLDVALEDLERESVRDEDELWRNEPDRLVVERVSECVCDLDRRCSERESDLEGLGLRRSVVKELVVSFDAENVGSLLCDPCD